MREYDARCVTTAAEIRELWEADATQTAQPEALADPDQLRLLDAMSSRVPIPIQELAKRSGLSPERVRALLGLFELDGGARREDGGWKKVSVDERRG